MHDIHIHTQLSSCARPDATYQAYRKAAIERKLSVVGFTDHLWDHAIPGWGSWYSPMDIEHILLLQDEIKRNPIGNIRVYFGCETEYIGNNIVTLHRDNSELFDFVLVPPHHFHNPQVRDPQITEIDKLVKLFIGEVSMLYAKAKVGKSSLAYSIAARVVAQGYTERPKPLIEGKNWLVPYGDYKVLYLDFENMGAIKQKQEDFQDKYFPSNAETATKCKENLIIKDCSGKKYNFLDNPEELFTLLEQVRNEGTKDKDVDLLVIDTYTKFVAGVEDGKRLDKLSTLLDRLKAKKMAILFVHHANNQNGLRGNQSKTDFTNLTINMSDSNSEKTGNLDERSCIIQLELTRMQIPSVYRNEFKIKYNAETKRWQIDIGKDKIEDEDKIEIEKNENEELQSVVSYFHEKGYNREDICKMLGIGKDNFSRKGIKFKKNPKKSHN